MCIMYIISIYLSIYLSIYIHTYIYIYIYIFCANENKLRTLRTIEQTLRTLRISKNFSIFMKMIRQLNCVSQIFLAIHLEFTFWLSGAYHITMLAFDMPAT